MTGDPSETIARLARRLAYDDALSGREPCEQARLDLVALAESMGVPDALAIVRDGAKKGLEAGAARRLFDRPEKHGVADDHQAPGDDGSWEPMEPIPSPPATPAMDIALVPEPLREWVTDTAAQMCVNPEMIAVPAIVAASSLLGSHVRVLPERGNGDYDVRPNLWGMTVAHAGGLKTPAQQATLKPIYKIAATARDEFHIQKTAADTERKVLQAELKNRELRKADPDLNVVRALEARIAELNVTLRRHVVEDCTPERLGMILAENPRGVLLASDELAGWFAQFKKRGFEGARSLYLKAWNGAASHTVDRVSREPLWVPCCCVSIIGSIQPARLMPVIRSAMGTAEPSEADGLLQRFQLLVWPDSRPSFSNRVRATPSQQAYRRAVDVFEDIEERCRELVDATLHFDDDAQAVFDDWRRQYEARLEDPSMESTPAWASMLEKYRSLIPSLAAIFHFVGGSGYGQRIGRTSLDLALRWVDYLELHQRKIYDLELNPGRIAAEALVQRLVDGQWGHGDSVRGLSKRGWSGLGSSDAVSAALHYLERLNWLRIVVAPIAPNGGRPSRIVALHPDLRGMEGGAL